MNAPGVHPDRRAALVIHGLPLPDQRAVLGRLDEAARTRITPLLRELDELGLPPQPALAKAALASLEPMPGRKPSLATASAAQVTRVLSGEPEGLIARVVAADDWPWEQAFLKLQPRSRQRQLREAVKQLRAERSGHRGALLRAALIGEVESRLESLTSDESPGHSWRRRAASAWRTIGQWTIRDRGRGSA